MTDLEQKPPHVEKWNWDSILSRLAHNWPVGELHPNVFDMAAGWCGWHGLVVDEKMTIHIDGKEYEVKRNK
jgi:hypothetical protein